MNLKSIKAEKEELLKQIIQEINTRKESIEKLNSEILQIEQQGLMVQGAVLAIQELMEIKDKENEPAVEAAE